MTNGVDVFIDKCNITIGAIVALLTYVFGIHWTLFAAFLLLNVCDFVTGCMKSRILGKTSSAKGAAGVWKKIGYWIMIMLSFGMVVIFKEIGDVIGINLNVTALLGWFVLASLIVNEIRSILENLVETGFKVPAIIVKGLEVANKMLDEDNSVDEKDG